MKKIIPMIALFFLMLYSVFGTVVVESNSSITTLSTLTATVTLNETCTGEIYVYSDSALTNLIASDSSTSNATTQAFTVTGLTGETTYYYMINGTSETPETTYSTGKITVTTGNYTLRGVVRTILNLFVFILIGVVSIYLVGSGKITKVRDLVILLATMMFFAMLLTNIISAILAI